MNVFYGNDLSAYLPSFAAPKGRFDSRPGHRFTFTLLANVQDLEDDPIDTAEVWAAPSGLALLPLHTQGGALGWDGVAPPGRRKKAGLSGNVSSVVACS